MGKRKHSIVIAAICLFALVLFSGCGAGAPSDGVPQATPAMHESAGDDGFASATNITSDPAEPEEAPIPNPSGGETGNLSNDQKLIYRLYLNIETLDYDASVTGLERLCKEMGGYVEHSSVSGSRLSFSSLRYADYTLRIPSDKLNAFETACGDIGNVYGSSRETENATAQYVDLSARLGSLQTEESRLLELLEQAGDLDSIIALNQRLSEVRYEIESIQSSLRGIDSLVSYSTVYITLSEVVSTTDASGVPRTFGERVSASFTKGMNTFKKTMESLGVFLFGSAPFALLTIVAVALPVGAVTLAVVLIVRSRKKKKAAYKAEETKGKEE